MTFGDIENDVLFGRDDELFLALGGHHVLDYAMRRRTISDEMISTFRTNLVSRRDYADKYGMRYVHIICPDKQSVLNRSFITPDPLCLGAHYLQCLSDCNLPVLYPLQELRQLERRTFMKTDTHLSDYGTVSTAILVGEFLLQRQLAHEGLALTETLKLHRHYVGDLGSKLDPVRSSCEIFSQISWKHSVFNNKLEGANNGGVNIIISPNAPFRKRLLWYGDSFGRGIVKFLSSIISEIVFLRTPFFHPEFAEQFRPDFLVTQTVERYLASCKPDNERPNFFMYPFFGNRSLSPDAAFAETFSAMMSFGRPPYNLIDNYFLKS